MKMSTSSDFLEEVSFPGSQSTETFSPRGHNRDPGDPNMISTLLGLVGSTRDSAPVGIIDRENGTCRS